MDSKTFKQLADNAQSMLINGQLQTAIDLMSNTLISIGTSVMQNELGSIQADYNRLLQFMADGSKDETRQMQHTRFIAKTFSLLESLRRKFRIENENDIYSIVAQKHQGEWMELLTNVQNAEDNLPAQEDLCFELLWTAPILSHSEEEQLRLFITSQNHHTQCYLLSAISLGLLHYLDTAKLRILRDYAISEEDDLRARALTGITAACLLHSAALTLYPHLSDEISKLLESEDLIQEVGKLQIIFCLYEDSERLQKKMEQDIIPTLVKLAQQRKNLGFDDGDIDLTDEESPLHIDKETRRKITNSMQEMARMFQDGLDVNLATFSALKGFPFFQTVGHWLLPFDKHRPEANLSSLTNKMRICDCDKYSLSILVEHIPEEQRQQMETAMGERLDEAPEEEKDEMKNVVQCLYRLLQRSPWRKSWPDLFGKRNFVTNSVLGQKLSQSPNYLSTIASVMFRHKRYEQAAQHLRLLSKLKGTDAEMLFNLGFCEEQQGQFQKAIRYYTEANILEPDKTSILHHLQHCYEQLERYDEQLQCLLTLEKNNPEKTDYTTQTGLCLMQLSRWQEAQQRFFRLEVMNQRVLPAQRAIAWCALRMGDYKLAAQYYDRILQAGDKKTKWEDYLNAAHTLWITGDTPAAIRLYREYVRRYKLANPKTIDVLYPFMNDAEVLMEHGKTASDINLMHDLIGNKEI